MAQPDLLSGPLLTPTMVELAIELSTLSVSWPAHRLRQADIVRLLIFPSIEQPFEWPLATDYMTR